jgi:hypothetical protein
MFIFFKPPITVGTLFHGAAQDIDVTQQLMTDKKYKPSVCDLGVIKNEKLTSN